MIISGQDPKTGQGFSTEVRGVAEEIIEELSKLIFSEEEISRKISSLDISADMKALLHSVSKTSFRAGRFIVRIGIKVLEIAFSILSEFPKSSGFMVLGAVLGVLVGSIPLIGMLLGPFVTPLLMGLGLVIGGLEDIKDATLKRKITKTVSDLESLKTVRV